MNTLVIILQQKMQERQFKRLREYNVLGQPKKKKKEV